MDHVKKILLLLLACGAAQAGTLFEKTDVTSTSTVTLSNKTYASPVTTGNVTGTDTVAAPTTYFHNFTATGSGIAGVNFIDFTKIGCVDTLDTVTLASATDTCLYINHLINAGFTGARQGLDSQVNIRGNATVAPGSFFKGASFEGTSTNNIGGATGLGNSIGDLVSYSYQTDLLSGATFYALAEGFEGAVLIHAGSSVDYVNGAKISTGGCGSLSCNVLALAGNFGYTQASLGIAFGSVEAQTFPVAPTGTLIGLQQYSGGSTLSFAHGIDFSNGTCGTDCFKSPSFSVDGSGNLVANAINSTAIGGSARAAGAFTTLAASGIYTSTVSGGGTSAGVLVSSASPALSWYVTGAAADGKTWDMLGQNTTWNLRAITDSQGSAVNAISITRSGAAISSIVLGNATNNPTFSFLGSGAISGTPITSLFASPPAIGGSAAAAGSFTTLAASSTVSGTGFSTYLASPPAIGGSAAAAGAFTTLSASSTVSGTGFSTYLASPPAIGGTAAAAGGFTQVTATASGGGSGAALFSKSASPSVAWDVTGAATDAKYWDFLGQATSFTLRLVTDNQGAAVNGIQFTRSGASLAQIIYGNTTNLVANTFNGPIYSTAGAAATFSGCGTAGTIRGNGTSGTFVVGTGAATCTFVITPGLTATTGWIANVDDVTAIIHCPNNGTIASTTTATAKCNSTVTTGDLITFEIRPF